MKRLAYSLAAVALAFCISGCGGNGNGPDRTAIKGTITHSGNPLSNASISYLPEAGHTGPSATTGVNEGKYQFTNKTGPAAGKHRVVIRLSPPGKQLGASDTPLGAADHSSIDGPTQWEFHVEVPQQGPFQKDFVLP